MWLASCCLPVAFSCAVMAVYLSTIFFVDGTSYRFGNELEVAVGFGHDAIEMIVVYQWDDEELANRTTIVSYDEVHTDLCVDKDLRNQNVDSSYCNAILTLKSSGRTYYSFIVASLAFMSVAAALAPFLILVRCLCQKTTRVGPYLVAGFATISVVSSVVAIFIAWNSIIKNAKTVLDQTYAYYYPVAELDTEWDGGHVGSSLSSVYISVIFGMISILAALILKNRSCAGCCNRGSQEHRPQGGENPPLLEAEGQVSSTQPYAQCPTVGEDASYRV